MRSIVHPSCMIPKRTYYELDTEDTMEIARDFLDKKSIKHPEGSLIWLRCEHDFKLKIIVDEPAGDFK